jgi:malonyl-CoA O-methyltransferase
MVRAPITALAARFSSAADTYDQSAQVQKTVAAQVAHLLADIPVPGLILEIGCGTGLLTSLLRQALPEATIHALDLSAGMLAEARTRHAHDTRLHWLLGDARQFTPATPYDLIASSSALHWIQPLPPLFINLRRALSPDGHLVFGLMLDGTLAELHAARQRVAPDNPARATLPTVTDVLSALQAAQFQVVQHERVSLNTHYPTASNLLQAIHEQGTTSGDLSQGSRPLRRQELRRLLEDYTSHYPDAAGGVYATYDVLYVVARPQKEAE